ncbi:MAG: ABC transporter ATP-binding protein [Pseudoxanthomonas sp.]
MSVFVRVRKVTLELPYESQGRAGAAAHGLLATFAATRRLYSSVLAGIDFDAGEGDRIGIMGLNGAGKTTLLRVLNGALLPTHGAVETKGSMQSLLSTMLGFNEYASLTENIILRGTAMGLRYRQVDAAVESILEFAGLSDRANHRLYTLSAGQRMRLGFAISTCVQPDILLMDEWIGAGDATFIERAKERMSSRFHGSRIVVLASHSTQLLRSMCNKALVLDRGRMGFYGDMNGGIEAYKSIISNASMEDRAKIAESDPLLFGNAVGLVERIRLTSEEISLEGWALGEKGEEVGAVVVEMDGLGLTHAFAPPERVDRQDVRLHLAKKVGNFGFKVSFPTPSNGNPEDVVSRIKVRIGRNVSHLGPPLPIAMAAVIDT